jgi:hypothetical protein
LWLSRYVSRDTPPEPVPANADVVDAFFRDLDALVVALDRADVSRATVSEMHRLLALLDSVGDALDPVVAAINAANGAS